VSGSWLPLSRAGSSDLPLGHVLVQFAQTCDRALIDRIERIKEASGLALVERDPLGDGFMRTCSCRAAKKVAQCLAELRCRGASELARVVGQAESSCKS
jgi:hypothetical protein